MFETIKSGGLIMIPLFICGIIATYIIIERCIYFYKSIFTIYIKLIFYIKYIWFKCMFDTFTLIH